MKRHTQLALWVILAPAFGCIQALSGFAVVLLWMRDLGSRDLRHLLLGLSLVYGGGWFLPALVVSDLVMLRRSLSVAELRRYILLIAITALVVGLLMPGMMVMIGYPTTACAILLYGFLCRKHRSVVARG